MVKKINKSIRSESINFSIKKGLKNIKQTWSNQPDIFISIETKTQIDQTKVNPQKNQYSNINFIKNNTQ